MGSYLGPGPVDTFASTQRVTTKFTGDGTRTDFYLPEQVPGAFESNLLVFINSVLQEPEEAYLIESAWKLDGSITGTFVLGETVTGGASGSTATVMNITAEYIQVSNRSDAFDVGETISGASASIVLSEETQEYGQTLIFSDAPDVSDNILAISLGSSTYQLQPAARSVGPEELQENLREFSVDVFDGGSSTYTLSKEVVSDNAVLVTLDGVVQNGSNNYSISGMTLTFSETVPSDVSVRVLYLGFTTSARRSVIDNSITTEKIVDGSITEPKVDNSVRIISARLPKHYERSRHWKVKSTTERTTIVSPDYMTVNINNEGYLLETAQELDITASGSWDDAVTTDWTLASNRIGKDFYIYTCVPSSGYEPDIILSANSDIPEGYTSTNSRKVGGFHTECADIGANVYAYVNEGKDAEYFNDAFVTSPNVSNGDTKHWLEGWLQGDILPFSIWDLKHRPYGDTEGRVYAPSSNKWIYIYLASWDDTLKKLRSVYGGTTADGTSIPAFHQYRFSQVFGIQGEELPRQDEFVSFSLGSPQGVNISGSADPGTTGGHNATNGLRIVSLIGVEDATGVLWQWGRDSGAGGSALWANAYDGNDANVGGQHYSAPSRPRFGGAWGVGAICGSRGSAWADSALYLDAPFGGRGVAVDYSEV